LIGLCINYVLILLSHTPNIFDEQLDVIKALLYQLIHI